MKTAPEQNEFLGLNYLMVGMLVAGLFILYLVSMPPGVTFEDTALFAAVCNTGGIPHPPGYPLHTLTCTSISSLVQLLGVSAVKAAAIVSALAGVAAVTVFCLLLIPSFGLPAAIVAAGGWGVSTLFWAQAILPETYSLNALLCVATFFAADRYAKSGNRRLLLLLALLGGLGLANHWPLYVITAPALLLWILPKRKWLLQDLRSKKLVLGCLLLFGIGLLPYIHLLVATDSAVLFDGELTINKLLTYVSRSAFDEFEVLAQHPRWELRIQAALATLGWLPLALGSVAGFGCVIGLVIMAARLQLLRRLAIVWGISASTVLLAWYRPYLEQSEVSVAIQQAYLQPALMFFVLGLAPVAVWLFRYLRLQQPAQLVLAYGIVILIAATNWPTSNRSNDDLAEKYIATLQATLPENSLLLLGLLSFNFPVYYYQGYSSQGKPLRSDVETEVVGDYLTTKGYRTGLQALPRYLKLETRPVLLSFFVPFTDRNLQLVGVAQQYHQEQEGMPPQLDEQARSFYRQAVANLNSNNAWTARFANRFIFTAVASLSRAANDAPLTSEDEELLKELSETPAGRYAKILVSEEAFSSPEKTLMAIKEQLGNIDELQNEWQSEVLHILATAHIQTGNFEIAREILEQALAKYPAPENSRVVVDLLLVLISEQDYVAYAKLRKQYPSIEGGRFLRQADLLCKTSLQRECKTID